MWHLRGILVFLVWAGWISPLKGPWYPRVHVVGKLEPADRRMRGNLQQGLIEAPYHCRDSLA